MPVEIDPWQVFDVSGWRFNAEQPVGQRAKSYVLDPSGVIWLKKAPRPSRPTEVAIEAFTTALARSTGLDAAVGYPAIDHDRQVFVSRYFMDAEDEEETHGSVLLQSLEPAYNPADHTLHSLARVRSVLESFGRREIVERFVEMLAFDAWIGNRDRHQANWGTISGLTERRLAPIYDTAACLGVELDDTRVVALTAAGANVARYAHKCPSGFGSGVPGSALLRLAQVVEELKTWPEWADRARTCVDRFRDALGPAERYLEGIDETWLSRPRQKLALDLLVYRLGWLDRQLPMTPRIDKLFVLWRVPRRKRYVVGTLARDADGAFTFEYASPSELAAAKAEGFAEVAGFPRSAGSEFRSPYLFATFADRVPPPNRPDIGRMMTEWGVVRRDDPLEILARSGGFVLNDRIELSEYREVGDDLSTPLSFPIAAPSHHDDPKATRAHVGDRVELRREPANAVDANAVLAVCQGEIRIGYVPAQYTPVFAHLMDEIKAQVSAQIERRLDVAGEGPRWVVRAWTRP